MSGTGGRRRAKSGDSRRSVTGGGPSIRLGCPLRSGCARRSSRTLCPPARLARPRSTPWSSRATAAGRIVQGGTSRRPRASRSPVTSGIRSDGCSWRSRSLRGPRGPVPDHLHRKWGLEGQSSHTGRATTVRQCPLRLAQKPRRHGGSRGGHGVIIRRPDHVRRQVHGLRPPPYNVAASSLRRKGARRPALNNCRTGTSRAQTADSRGSLLPALVQLAPEDPPLLAAIGRRGFAAPFRGIGSETPSGWGSR